MQHDRVTRIDFDGQTIRAHIVRERDYGPRPQDHMSASLKQIMAENNLTNLFDGFEGYGFAFDSKRNEWVEVDIKDGEVRHSIRDLKKYVSDMVRCKTIPEIEWTSSCSKIPVIFSESARKLLGIPGSSRLLGIHGEGR